MKITRRIFSVVTLIAVFFVFLGSDVKKTSAYDTHDYLASNSAFININALNVDGIQSFLASKNSFLRNYSENGRTAAQIIHGAAHGYGDASGSINGITINSTTGTINPYAIMASLQKEQSLITRTERPGDNVLNAAMGYGCPDGGGCSDTYRGFTKQVEWGAWQLRYNYERAYGHGFTTYQVGQAYTFDDHRVILINRTTSSLYRYTPHLGGNQNFKTLFNQWGGELTYEAQYLDQGPKSGLGINGVALLPGQKFTIWANYKNTGTATWTKTGLTPVRFGTTGPQDRLSPFLGNQSLRGYMAQTSVAPGQIGTFKIQLTAPNTEGSYTERFQPVVENVKFMGPCARWDYTVSKSLAASQTSASFYRKGPTNYTVILGNGATTTLWVKYKNTGKQIWFREGANATHLGASSPVGRKSAFLASSSSRGYLVESVVYPGHYGTFQVNITAPSTDGKYIEYFKPVMEDVTWFGSRIYWPISVR